MSEHSGVPIVVLYQTINVATVGLIIFFATRKQIVSAIASRKETHEEKVRAARLIVDEAEEKNQAIKNKIKTVEAEREKTIEEARLQAELLKTKIIEDAKKQAEQIKADAQKTIQYEFERAKNDLRNEVLEEVLKMSQANIEKNMSERKQQALNKEFVAGVKAH